MNSSGNYKIALDARYVQEHFPGIGRYVYDLAKGLAELDNPSLDFELSLIYNPALPDRRHRLPELAKEYPERLRLVETEVRPFSAGEQWQLFGLARREKFDLWHAPYYIRPYFLPCPSVLTFYDVIARHVPDALPSRKSKALFEVTTRLALARSPHLIAISKATRQDIQKLYGAPSRKIRVIPLAADARFRPFSEAQKVEARARLNLPASYILYVGINKPHKNLTRLIEAFQIFRGRTNSNAVLLLAGREDPRYAPALREKARAIGLSDRDVRFWGEVNEQDLPALYACADLFVFPSLYEGFGLPVLEAMANATPVICADNSSLPEVAGEAALLFPAEDTNALAKRLEEVMQNPAKRTEMIEKGLAQAKRFSWQNTARQTLDYYREILNSRY